MLNSDEEISLDSGIQNSPTVSVILVTRNFGTPLFLYPERIKSLIPKGISSEIILIKFNQNTAIITTQDTKIEPECITNSRIDIMQTRGEIDNKIIFKSVTGNFTTAVLKGLELTTGKFILVTDVDFPYPEELVPKLIAELINSPNSIIIASKHSKGKSIQELPLIKTVLSKTARIIIRHGLKVENVQDPLSGCFAISRQILGEITIEGKGEGLLLEILVKLSRNKKYKKIPIKELQFRQELEHISNKIDLGKIVRYSKAIWNLYRFGRKSGQIENSPDYIEQKQHRSVLFLSKAGRFFTVGASGFVINYFVSLLVANAISNIWYIHATMFGIIISITSNFILNKVWTFEDKDFTPKHVIKQYFSFLALCAFGAVIQISLTYVFFERWHIQYAISLMLAVSVASISNFLLNKKLTFGEKIWE
jgi:dolichol-phosphate mannosyltransferase